MRQYDKISDRRFDMNHPVWQSGMRTKDNKVRSRMDWPNARALEAKGLIDLRTSVTEIAKVADGFGVFNFAKNWGVDMTMRALDELMGEGTEWTPGQVKARAQAIMAAPGEKGSALHQTYHDIHTGVMRLESASDDQRRYFTACEGALKRIGYLGEYRTEVEFCNDSYGGTCDLDAGSVGVDWKTVEKFRQPRNSELLQVAAYADHFQWREAWIVYIHQSTFEVKLLKFTEVGKMDAKGKAIEVSLEECVVAFYQAADLLRGIGNITAPAKI